MNATTIPAGPLLSAEHLSWKVNGTTIVHDVSLSVTAGTMLGIVGPNGSGKTSVLRMLAGLTAPSSGKVLFSGAPIGRLRRRDIARELAYVEQISHTELDLKVRDVVALGRLPHHRSWTGMQIVSTFDRPIIEEAARQTGITHLLERPWAHLSGGERQRTQLARALAQQTPLILLDEPTNHLDISHQLDILRLVRTSDSAAIAVLHDLNLAAMFCDRLLVMDGGQVVAEGTPAEVLSSELLADVFSVTAIIDTVEDDCPSIRYLL